MGNPISRELFLERARSRFGDQYDYSAIVYKSYKTPIKIRCTSHPVKEISITPEKHLQTMGGCKYCLREKRILSLERELNRASADRPQTPIGLGAGEPPQVIGALPLSTRLPG
ncbi:MULTISPECIES: hypothetical protein [Synechococcales]|uniref:hypothetical protein n=1 Tax=Synechococcales TaxID=1890424 RepID=UPI001E5EB31B|nr:MULTISPECIES: hypothetical protein [Synechococcales]